MLEVRPVAQASRATCANDVVEMSGAFHHFLHGCQTNTWLSVDLTMPQLKTLLIIVGSAGATGGQLARGLGVTLSTVTGIVDRLHGQGLVTRCEDPMDRRITRVVPTTAGRQIVDSLYEYQRVRLGRLFEELTDDQLHTVRETFRLLASAVERVVIAESDQPMLDSQPHWGGA